MDLKWTILFQYIEVAIVLCASFSCMSNTQAFISNGFLPQYQDDAQFLSHPGLIFMSHLYALMLFLFALIEFLVFHSGNMRCIVYFSIVLCIGDTLHSVVFIKFMHSDLFQYHSLLFGPVGISCMLLTESSSSGRIGTDSPSKNGLSDQPRKTPLIFSSLQLTPWRRKP